MDLNETIISKIKKLAALAERGVDGERRNAEYILNKYLAQYGVTLEEIFSNEGKEKEWCIRYKTAQEHQLIVNCIANIFGSKSKEWKNTYRYRTGKSELFIKCTKAKWIILEDFINFHLTQYRFQLEVMQKNFFYAYLEKHQIYNKDKDDSSSKKKNKYDEMIDAITILKMVDNMGGDTYQQKIQKNTLRLENK